jgi:ankyrin repeat protein
MIITSLVLAGALHLHQPSPAQLVEAAREGDARSVRRLVAAGSDPNAPDGGNDWPPLLHAIHKDQLSSVDALLSSGADINRASHGVTPLMMAAGYGYTPIVELLIRRGANLRAQDENGDTALDWAVAGMTDIDRFTFFQCQDATVRALLTPPHAPRQIRPAARRWGRIKRCESMSLLP